MDNEKKNTDYLNMFDNKDIKNGIRVNINSTDDALQAVKDIFHAKKPNYAIGLEGKKIQNINI